MFVNNTKHFEVKPLRKQESPPAWTQEAYRLPCSDYSFCCPILADPPPPTGWTWPSPPPAGPDPPLPAGPDPPPPTGWTWPHLASWTWLPLPAGPDPPPGWTWPPCQLDLTPRPPSWTEDWPPPLAELRTDPPPCGQTESWMDGWTDTCQNITFPSYYVRGR